MKRSENIGNMVRNNPSDFGVDGICSWI